jgi:cell division protein FtsA
MEGDFMHSNKKIFALDIGTRSVVGIILEEHENQYRVLDMRSEEHQERAMLDGQIHDVPAVSKVISSIKNQLETEYGPLRKVCVAAAGRALKTEKALARFPIKGKPMMTKDDILHIELTAVQQAQSNTAEKLQRDHDTHYYCVGYSVLKYRLDDQEIGSLIDQQGDEASVEIIATFLPRVVVESLLAALNRSGLEMEGLTLEPIAAINVLIPPSMRRLNVALVDIGAGTSDIALTDQGTVIAYGMVPTAGDEITEAFSDEYLLDFQQAEQAKRDLSLNEVIHFTDILGFEQSITKEEIEQKLSSSIEHLSLKITEEIYKLNNNRSPKAVMLVGGGSQTPGLTKRLAAALSLPDNRVAIRGIEAIQSLDIHDRIPRGPELVTPIGIAIAAYQNPVQYRTVYVNDQPIRLFELKTLTVGDCLLAAGIKMGKLYGRPGMAKIISFNGKMITLPGEYGQPPNLSQNDLPCSLNAPVSNGDKLIAQKGTDGRQAILTIQELMDETSSIQVKINGRDFSLDVLPLINQKTVTLQTKIEDRDEITVSIPRTLREVLGNNKVPFQTEDHFMIKWNEQKISFPDKKGHWMVNNHYVSLDYLLQDKDQIDWVDASPLTLQEVADRLEKRLEYSMTVFFNDEQLQLVKIPLEVTIAGDKLSPDSTIHSGDQLVTHEIPTQPFIFQDVFRHVEIETPTDASGSFFLLKNGMESTFYEEIQMGDRLELRWPLIKRQ